MNRRADCRERRGQIGRVCRDTVAGLQAMLAVITDLGVAGIAATQPALPFLTAVVPAAGVLAEIAADSADVAQERRGCLARCRDDRE